MRLNAFLNILTNKAISFLQVSLNLSFLILRKDFNLKYNLPQIAIL